MNGLDYAIVIIIVVGALAGLRQGMIGMFTSTIALVAAVFIASVYYPAAGTFVVHQFGANPTVASAIGFFALFGLVFVGIEVLGTMLTQLLYEASLGWANRLMGAIVGAGIAAAIMGLVVMMLAAVLPTDAAILRNSRLSASLMVYDQELVRFIPVNLKQAYEEKRAALVRYWIESEARLIENMAAPQPSPTVRK